MNIPFLDFGGTGSPLHFLHANGYPPACYRAALQAIIISLSRLWDVLASVVAELKSRRDQRLDIHSAMTFSNFLMNKKLTSPIAMGHSIGATVSMRAALKEPHRFRALVLIEPVLFPLYFMLEWNMVRALGLGHRLHPKIQAAFKRRRDFDDLDQVFAGYRRRPIFRYLSDEHLRIFIQGMTRPKNLTNQAASTQRGFELVLQPRNGKPKFTILASGMIGIYGWAFLGWIFQR